MKEKGPPKKGNRQGMQIERKEKKMGFEQQNKTAT